MTTVVFGAHPDDCILGCGGTILKLTREERVVLVTFTWGQGFPFWKNQNKVSKKRAIELEEAGSNIGIDKTIFLGLKDMGIEKEKAKSNIREVLKNEKPDKIFYHTKKDPHSDHRTINRAVEEVLKEIEYEGKKYCYGISMPTWLAGSSKDAYSIMDISDTFTDKIKALFEFKSQKILLMPLVFLSFVNALYSGLTNSYRYAERFYSK